MFKTKLFFIWKFKNSKCFKYFLLTICLTLHRNENLKLHADELEHVQGVLMSDLSYPSTS